ncbi:MAG: MAPEG family protein [Pseudomonadota bacterium]
MKQDPVSCAKIRIAQPYTDYFWLYGKPSVLSPARFQLVGAGRFGLGKSRYYRRISFVKEKTVAISLLCVGLLGVLIFLLGFNVSRERGAVIKTQHEAEADPASGLRKAMRAHGNSTEYVPMLALMILALGLRLPIMPIWIGAIMVAAVACRYLHAAGVLFGSSVYEGNALKFVGALGTYVTGFVMALILVYRAARLVIG